MAAHFLLLKKSSFHGKAIWGTPPPLIRVLQESIVLLCSSVICSPVNVLICKEHSNFINEDRKNFRLSKLFRSHEKRVSRVFRTFKFVEQLETKNCYERYIILFPYHMDDLKRKSQRKSKCWNISVLLSSSYLFPFTDWTSLQKTILNK